MPFLKFFNCLYAYHESRFASAGLCNLAFPSPRSPWHVLQVRYNAFPFSIFPFWGAYTDVSVEVVFEVHETQHHKIMTNRHKLDIVADKIKAQGKAIPENHFHANGTWVK